MSKSSLSVDVTILGGGPAGTAVALKLRQHDPSLSVALIEKSRYQKPRIGESLPPGTQAVLEDLDAWDSFPKLNSRPAYGIESNWGRPSFETNDFLFNIHGHGWIIDRAAFDCHLLELAQKRGARIMLQSRARQFTRTKHNTCTFEVDSPAGPSALETQFIIDATGRAASFARSQGATPVTHDHLVGIHGIFDTRQPSPTRIEASPAGWWYSTSLPSNRRLVTCFTDRDLARPIKQNWSPPAGIRETIQGSSLTGPLKTTPAHSQILDSAIGPDWLAVGDAASTYDPLSSQGILKGLRHGVIAAYALANGPRDFPKYQRVLEEEFENYLETRDRFYATETRWSDQAFWKRRLHQIELSPHTALTRTRLPPSRRPDHLTPSQVDLALRLCSTPTPAHQIASTLQQKNPALSTSRIITGLQQLLKSGLLISQ